MYLKPPKGILVERGDNFARGLIALYIMNAGGGNRLIDLSGNAHHGVLTNMEQADWIGGLEGPALKADGDPERVVISDRPQVRIGTKDFTIVVQAAYLAGGGSYPCFIGKGDTGAGEWMLRLTATAGDPGFYGDGGGINVSFTSSWSNGAWHQLAVRRQGTTVQLFQDAIYQAQDTTAGDDLNSAKSIELFCADATSTRYFNGKITWLGFWMKPLTNEEIARLYRDMFR